MVVNDDYYDEKKKIVSPVDKTLYQKYWAGLLYFVLASQFILVIMLCAAIAPNYDIKGAAISDFGVIGETRGLFNTSLMLGGILNIIGGTFYFKRHKKYYIFLTNIFAGIGALGTGLFPLDISEFHSLFALLAFFFFNLQAILMGINLKGPIKLVGIFLGILGLVYLIIMIIGDSGDASIFGIIGHGGTERMIVYPPLIWLIVMGGFTMGETRLYK